METLDRASIIKEYMTGLAMKSVEVQKKKYGRRKFVEMGKKAGITHKRKAEERARKRLEESGEAIEGVILR